MREEPHAFPFRGAGIRGYELGGEETVQTNVVAVRAPAADVPVTVTVLVPGVRPAPVDVRRLHAEATAYAERARHILRGEVPPGPPPARGWLDWLLGR